MPSPDAALAFAAASFALFLIPGPAVAYIVNRSIADGRTTDGLPVLPERDHGRCSR